MSLALHWFRVSERTQYKTNSIHLPLGTNNNTLMIGWAARADGALRWWRNRGMAANGLYTVNVFNILCSIWRKHMTRTGSSSTKGTNRAEPVVRVKSEASMSPRLRGPFSVLDAYRKTLACLLGYWIFARESRECVLADFVSQRCHAHTERERERERVWRLIKSRTNITPANVRINNEHQQQQHLPRDVQVQQRYRSVYAPRVSYIPRERQGYGRPQHSTTLFGPPPDGTILPG